jgi:hypothetical protein
MTHAASVQLEIASVCDQIKDLLLKKNSKYGNSALDPVRIFSHAHATDQLLVRIDDKLSRIKRGAGLVAADEDVINDLIGYLVLLKISMKSQQPTQYEEVIDFFHETEDVLLQRLYGGTDICVATPLWRH